MTSQQAATREGTDGARDQRPFPQDAFGTVALAVDEWMRIVALALLIVPVLAGAKWAVRHGWLGDVQRA